MRKRVLYTVVMLFVLGVLAITLALYPFKNSVLGNVLLGLGVTLIASGITPLIFELSAPTPGIVSDDDRSQLDKKKLILSSGNRLDLMGITLPDITAQGMLPSFEAAMRDSGTHVRILLLDPTCEAAAIRSGYPTYLGTQRFKLSSYSSLDRLRHFGTTLRDKGTSVEMFDVRLYTELPLGLTINDHVLILSVYTTSVNGQNAPYLTFDKTGLQHKFAVGLKKHFETVWESSKNKSIIQMGGKEFAELLNKVKQGLSPCTT
jgi:hypothetical protein